MSQPDLPEMHPPRRRRRVVLLILGLLLLPLGLLVAYLFEVREAADRELREALAETDRRDPGWRLEDLDRQRPTIPDERNGALRVAAARRLLPATWPAQAEGRPALDTLLTDLPPEQRPGTEQLRELRAQLQAVQPALSKAESLVDYPDGQFALTWPLDYVGARIDPVQESRAVARLLELEALRQAEEGDADGACRTVLALVNTGRAIGDEYTLIVLLVRTSIETTAVQTLERTLAQGEPSEASLAAVQKLLEREEAETPAATVMAFRGERALQHRMLDAVERGELALGGSGPPSAGERLSLALNAGMIRRSHVMLLRYMTEAVELAKAPGPRQLDRRQELMVPDDPRAMLAVLLLPAADKVLGSEWRKLAQLRCAIVAVAAERYRRAHGRWPESPEALTPAYLERVPADPYDDRPLRLRRLEDGVVIYSVGPDRTDDGGRLDRKDPLAAGNDLGFRLWDVARRRQSPAAAR